MRWHLVLFAPLSLTACGDDGGGLAEPTVGNLEISTATTGTAPDPDGYIVSVDGGAARPVGVNGSLTVADLVPGAHSVALSGLSADCAVAGDNPRAVTISGGATARVAFSIDCRAIGSRIAFASDRDGDFEIYTMAPDGSNVIQVTNHPAPDDEPAWSPDGSKIAFRSSRNFVAGTSFPGIFVMNADGSNVIQLTNQDDAHPAWSPDGSRIAFESFRDGDGEIYVMNADGSNVTRLTTEPGDDTQPTWSPDGQQIAFESGRTGKCSADILVEIYVTNADGSNVRPVTCSPLAGLNPSWSPDGSRIAFQGFRLGDEDQEVEGIFVVNADGSNPVPLTSEREDDPTWSPDGTRIAFTSSPLGPMDIYVMSADGSNATRLTDHLTGEDMDPAWSP